MVLGGELIDGEVVLIVLIEKCYEGVFFFGVMKMCGVWVRCLLWCYVFLLVCSVLGVMMLMLVVLSVVWICFVNVSVCGLLLCR